jgi:hypothetical protein
MKKQGLSLKPLNTDQALKALFAVKPPKPKGKPKKKGK